MQEQLKFLKIVIFDEKQNYKFYDGTSAFVKFIANNCPSIHGFEGQKDNSSQPLICYTAHNVTWTDCQIIIDYLYSKEVKQTVLFATDGQYFVEEGFRFSSIKRVYLIDESDTLCEGFETEDGVEKYLTEMKSEGNNNNLVISKVYKDDFVNVCS